MSEISIKIKNLPQIKSAFRKAPTLMPRELDIAIRKSVFLIRAKAQGYVSVRSGYLRGSAYNTFGPLRGEVGFRANYAAAVHDGSKAHIIEPRFKKALFWKGLGHPVMRVNHPGYKGNPFLKKGVDESQSQVDGFMTQAVENVLDKIGRSIH